MADGVQFSPATAATIGVPAAVSSNKRKYEDRSTTSPPPPSTTRRPSGFSSAPITSSSPDSSNLPPSSYTTLPPPIDGIQLAKQRAQEIAARLFNSVDPKRLPENDQKPPFSNFHPGSGGYGYQGTSKKMEIPNNRVGVIIGKSGETVKYLQLQSGAKIQITRDMDADPSSQSRLVELMGTQEQIDKAEQLVNDVLAEAEAGASSLVNKRLNGQAGSESFVMKIPNTRVGLVIGKGGETIKSMQATTGARIQVIPLHLPPGDMSTERTIQIDGTSDQIESAQQMVTEVISENRMRNQSSLGGGYTNNHQPYQQSYQQQPQQQQQPPTNWGGAPPMNQQPQQQPGYGYMQQQPLPYSGPPPQYNTPQPASYPTSYPSQPQSAGYAASWDVTNQNPQSNQGGGGYDYYTQQPQIGTPGAQQPQTTTQSYTYTQQQQQPVYPQSQGYTSNPQDGYGGGVSQQPVYGQQQNHISGYEQQGYSNTYGGATNQTQDVNSVVSYGANMAVPQMQSPAALHGYGAGATQQQTSPNTGYGMPVQSSAAQPGYGNQPTMIMGQGGYAYGGVPVSSAPPSSQAPKVSAAVVASGYAQSQASPGVQAGGYVNPSAAVYAHQVAIPSSITHQQTAGYGQVEAGGAQPNYNSGYGSAYAAPPMSMYGHQQLPTVVAGAEKNATVGGGNQTVVPSP